jgi:hypothetical protein
LLSAAAVALTISQASAACDNVICKCEKVTEAEVVAACHRALPIDSTQAIRKRTRAGMGNCQGKGAPAQLLRLFFVTQLLPPPSPPMLQELPVTDMIASVVLPPLLRARRVFPLRQ